MAATAQQSDRRIGRTLLLALTVGVGLLGLIQLLHMFASFDDARVLRAMVLATLPVPLYVALGLRIDRYEPEPAKLLAWAFLWGACGATFIALVLNTVGGAIVGSSFGAEVGELYTSNVSAPIVEESAKAAALLGIYLWRRSEFNGVLDGIAYALMVGLGFAMVENIGYYAKWPESFFVRGVLSPYGHPLFTAMTGIGFGIASLTHDRRKKLMAIVLGLAGAMIAHSIWNGVFGGSGHFFLWYACAGVPAFIAVLVIIRNLNRSEGRIVSKYLRPDVQSGLLSEDEVKRLSSLRERRKAMRAAKERGKGAHEAEKAFQKTATELAFQRRDNELHSRGETPDEQEQERAFASAIQALREASRHTTPVEPAEQAQQPAQSPPEAQQPAESSPPAGWYADPWQAGRLRFWDGRAYTWHTAGASPGPSPGT